MKTLYLDCGMGAAGDMLTAALLELLPDADGFVKELNALGIPEVEYTREPSVKCGIIGTHMTVKVHGEEEVEHHHHDHDHDHEHHHDHDSHEHHHHSRMTDIAAIVNALSIPAAVKEDVLSVYGLIAEAESHAHGVPVTEIHFHEVGTMDAIADVTAVCLLMHRLAPRQVIVSPIHVGSGHVHCAHGILPVPAPATAYILKDAPIYGGGIKGELCTPTGAALLKHFATGFGSLPVMKTSAIGYGMGKKDFTAANCIRALLGDTTETADSIAELSCNMDDMTGEELGFAMDRLFAAGALEVYTTPVGMKKNRPGVLLTVLCPLATKEQMVEIIFRNTTTIGVRESIMQRYTLDRRIEALQTPFGEVHRKISTGYGVTRSKFEYDNLAKIARECDCSIEDVKAQLESGTWNRD